MISTFNKSRCASIVSVVSVVHFHSQNIYDLVILNIQPGNCFTKCDNKPFTLHTSPLTSGHLKKEATGMQKSHVKYFAGDIN